ncbi:cellulose biosynthesis protein BcsC [Telmatospirillum siberiense]|uniref:Cellulose synthase operon C C-terminal domain-containing protein n=1 Tax=Telmatospirillum siberiense TaxID=382514 RepID=A0A2N3PZA8_9PROT|nr:cellulose biosynthesis protein BcsC [Telmatospirillum siberiense]PKU25743.1 hypothetical protein CWS72_04030 [Telmatospirillum siberiense]
MSYRRFLAASMVAAASLIGVVANAQSQQSAGDDLTPAQRRLVEQARYWQTREKTELAIEAWSRLLDSSRDNSQALYNLGLLEVSRSRVAAAQHYLDQLRMSNPGSPLVEDLAQTIKRGPIDQAMIDRARYSAQRGEVERAVEFYRSAFGRARPPANLALEYYQTLVGTKVGWAEAKTGLEQLVADAPSDSRARLALAQALTYRDDTRRDGISRLAVLSRDAALSRQAGDAWRQALLWLSATPDDIALYRDYLSRVGHDPAIEQKQADISNPKSEVDPRSRARREAFEILQRGDFAVAAESFEHLLKANPDDGDALGGLGVIRLRQNRFSDAWALLDKATKAAPDRAGQWQQALQSAAYWSLVDAAKAARARGRFAEAQEKAQQALGFASRDEVTALSILGDVLISQNHPVEAEKVFRTILERKPDAIEGIGGMVTAMRREGRNAEAQHYLDGLPPIIARRFAEVAKPTGKPVNNALRDEALAAARSGDDAKALQAFERALAAAPADPWLRLDYARFLKRQGQDKPARDVIDAMLGNHPGYEAQYAGAIFYDEVGEAERAAALLQQVPSKQLPSTAGALRQRLVVKQQTAEAVRQARAGDAIGARQRLRRLAESASTVESVSAIASAYYDIGAKDEALAIARGQLAPVAGTSGTAALAYASLLDKMGQDAEALDQLVAAERLGGLSDEDRKSMTSLRTGLAIRQADALRSRGRLADAYDRLSRELSTGSNDSGLLLALARLYEAGSRPRDAEGIFSRVLAQDPQNRQALAGMARCALARNDYTQAAKRLDQAFAVHPDDPNLYVMAAQVYRQRGDDSKAMTMLERARSLAKNGTLDPQIQTPPSSEGGGALPNNPFVNRSSRADEWGPAILVAMNDGAVMSDADPYAGWAPLLRAGNIAGGVQVAQADLVGDRSTASSSRIDNPFGLPAVPWPAPPRLSESDTAPPSETSPLAYPAVRAPAPVKKAAPAQPARKTVEAQASAIPTPLFPAVPLRIDTAATARAVIPVPQLRLDTDQGGNQQVADAAPSAELLQDIDRQIDDLRGKVVPVVEGNFNYRHREGETGFSRLDEMGATVRHEQPVGGGRLGLQAAAVDLNSGSSSTDSNTLRRLGSNATVAAGAMKNASSGQQSGAVAGIDYQWDNLKMDVGSTPMGFLTHNLVGGASWAPSFANRAVTVTMEGLRRSVTDSLLSYAGIRDPQTGKIFGGVVETGGKVMVSHDNGKAGVYGGSGYSVLNGQNVEANRKLSASAGVYFRPIKQDGKEFKFGVDLSTEFFERNVSYYTWGHGGYFSPQRYVQLSTPVEYKNKWGELSYDLTGALGIQSYSRNAVAYFPTSSTLQSNADAQANGLATSYAAESVTGLGYNLGARAEYPLTPTLKLGGRISVSNAHDYNEQSVLIFLRQSFGND